MTQTQLAEKLGVTDKAVSKWERDLSYPDITLFPKLADVLGATVNDLLRECQEDCRPSRLLQVFEVSRDIRTPLHIMLGFVEIAKQNHGDPEMLMRYLEGIKVFSGADQQEDFDFSGQRTLIVDDMAVNREIAVEVLRKTGAVTETAEDGLICLQKVESMPAGYYDLILMDVMMPNMDGLGNSVARESALEKAANELTKEEYSKLMTLLETTGHISQ